MQKEYYFQNNETLEGVCFWATGIIQAKQILRKAKKYSFRHYSLLHTNKKRTYTFK